MDQPTFGSLAFIGEKGSKISWEPMPYDRLAVGPANELLFVSVIADTGIVKGMRGALNTTNNKFSMQASGGAPLVAGIKKASEQDDAWRQPGTLTRVTEGYKVEYHRLDFGQAHAMLFAKVPGFLMSISEESVWRELNSDRFSTPLLRGWVPWLMAEMRRHELLVEASCFRCECGLMRLTSPDLDALVSDGVRRGKLKIDKEHV